MTFNLHSVLNTMRTPVTVPEKTEADYFDDFIRRDRKYQQQLKEQWDYNPAMP